MILLIDDSQIKNRVKPLVPDLLGYRFIALFGLKEESFWPIFFQFLIWHAYLALAISIQCPSVKKRILLKGRINNLEAASCHSSKERAEKTHSSLYVSIVFPQQTNNKLQF